MNIISPAKRRVEVISIKADFSDMIPAGDSIVSAVVAITLWAGEDPNPSAMLYNVYLIQGKTVSQRVAQGIPGCVYVLEFFATSSSGKVYDQSGKLAVIPDGVPGDDVFLHFYRTSLIYPLESVESIDTGLDIVSAQLYSWGIDALDTNISIDSANLYQALRTYNRAVDACDTNITLVDGTLVEIVKTYSRSEDACDTIIAIISAELISFQTIVYTTGLPEAIDTNITINSAALYVP